MNPVYDFGKTNKNSVRERMEIFAETLLFLEEGSVS
jgi:hypothetical protein